MIKAQEGKRHATGGTQRPRHPNRLGNQVHAGVFITPQSRLRNRTDPWWSVPGGRRQPMADEGGRVRGMGRTARTSAAPSSAARQVIMDGATRYRSTSLPTVRTHPRQRRNRCTPPPIQGRRVPRSLPWAPPTTPRLPRTAWPRPSLSCPCPRRCCPSRSHTICARSPRHRTLCLARRRPWPLRAGTR